MLKKAIDCTMDEIRAARRAAIDAKTGSPTNHREPAEVTAVREQFTTRTLSAIKIRFNDGVFSFSNVAGFALHEFADALKLAEWESAKPRKTTRTKGKC